MTGTIEDSPGHRRIPRPVLLAGAAVLVVGALIAMAISGPDAPRGTAIAPLASPPVPTPAPATSDPTTPAPSPSPTPSRSPTRTPSRSPSPTRGPSRGVAGPVSYEAEAPGNVLDNGARVAPMDGASGGAGVYGIGGGDGGTLSIPVTVPASGTYRLTIYYQEPNLLGRLGYVSVDGGEPDRIDFADTGSCCVASLPVTVTLTAGAHTIGFANPDGRAPDIDRIVLGPTA